MKRIITTTVLSLSLVVAYAQGWPAQWQGVMLQGFYWDSFTDTQWSYLEGQADELAEFFKLIWVPQSGNCGTGDNMGYSDLYWFTNYTSSFGNEQELRSMIQTFKDKGLGTIADVVINHRSSLPDTWMSFPEETYNGVTYTMGAADICCDDDSGKTAAQAEIVPTGAKDTGDDFDGARDLDHSSANVQTIVKAYLDFLLNDLGYTGFRYDMVKGYSPEYTIMYNQSANPTYSVGEYWDGNFSTLSKWVDNTKVDGMPYSAAFDFVLKYYLRDCCNAGSSWSKLSQSSLMNQTNYQRYAVTFVDNHDTFNRGNDSETTANILAANAFILAAPGNPCIFLPHWKSYKHDIKNMIYARNAAGIHNQSAITSLYNASTQYAIAVTGTTGSVAVIMGSQSAPAAFDADSYTLISSGDNFSYYLSKSTNTAWTDMPSGEYDDAIDVTLSAISTTADATIVYTTDGTTPSASNGTQVTSGTTITIGSTTTLTAALLINGATQGLITRNYTITGFQPHDITVYVKADWSTMYYYMWDSNGAEEHAWAGVQVTDKTTIDGIDWYYRTYNIPTSDYYLNFVFSQGSNANQTENVNNVNTTSFFVISDSKNSGGKYEATDVTAEHSTGISATHADIRQDNYNVYSMDGRLVKASTTAPSLTGLNKGVYLVNGKKVVVK